MLRLAVYIYIYIYIGCMSSLLQQQMASLLPAMTTADLGSSRCPPIISIHIHMERCDTIDRCGTDYSSVFPEIALLGDVEMRQLIDTELITATYSRK